MKKILFFAALACLAASCDRKEDYTGMGSVDKRVTEKLNEYQKVLCDAPHGWMADVETGLNGTHRMWMGFAADGKVTMYTDYAEFYPENRTKPNTSTYAMKAQQLPALCFDTYTYITALADPNPGMNHGEGVVGVVADYEYYIDGYEGGVFKATGIKNGMSLVLTPATEQEKQAATEGWLIDAILQSPLYQRTYFALEYGGVDYDLVSNGRKTALNYLSGNTPGFVASESYTDPDGSIILREPIELNGEKITRFDKAASGYTAQVGSQLVEVKKTNSSPANLFGLGSVNKQLLCLLGPEVNEWGKGVYSMVINVLSNCLNLENPMRLMQIEVSIINSRTANVILYFYPIINGEIVNDPKQIISTSYRYELTENADGSLTFGNYELAYSEHDTNSQLVKVAAKEMLDGYFKNRTFMARSWPGFFMGYIDVPQGMPYIALVPMDADDAYGPLIGNADL